MSEIEIAVTEETVRHTCYVCGKRRLCRFVIVGETFGVGYFVCSDHPRWHPVEGRDYEVEDAD